MKLFIKKKVWIAMVTILLFVFIASAIIFSFLNSNASSPIARTVELDKINATDYSNMTYEDLSYIGTLY